MRRGSTSDNESAPGGGPTLFLPAKETHMSVATAPIETDEATETENERVLRWRWEELRRAGFGFQDALMLAVSREVDLHLATGLLARGCPPETALRILV